jgi:hypothetical protein
VSEKTFKVSPKPDQNWQKKKKPNKKAQKKKVSKKSG